MWAQLLDGIGLRWKTGKHSQIHLNAYVLSSFAGRPFLLRAQQAIDSEYIFKHQRLRERQIRVVLSLASLNLGLLCIPLSLRESRGIRLGYVAGQQQLLDSGLANLYHLSKSHYWEQNSKTKHLANWLIDLKIEMLCLFLQKFRRWNLH